MNSNSKLISLVTAILVGFVFHFALPKLASAEPLTISRVVPSGLDVAIARQIVFTFDRPVVPLGKMDRKAEEIPITIEPPLNCEWRWLNTSSLACQLSKENTFKPSSTYEVQVTGGQKGFVALDGSKLASTYKHSFTTLLPRVSRHYFKKWNSPTSPQLRLKFNQAVKKSSLEDHLYFTTVEQPRHSIRVEEVKGSNARDWYIEPRSELPANISVKLKIEAGIKSTSGSALGNENRVIAAFDTFGDFKFEGLECYAKDQSSQKILIAKPSDATKRCDPLDGFELLFSSPVAKEELKKGISFEPSLKGDKEDFDPWTQIYTYSGLHSVHKKGQHYAVRIPIAIKAFDDYKIKALRESIKDRFGRTLAEDISFTFSTSHRRPNFNFPSPWAVLEKDVKTHVPIFFTNLEKYSLSYTSITANNQVSSSTYEEKLPAVEDISYIHPLKTRELLNNKSGLVFGSLSTTPHTGQGPDFFFNQVTPFQVHLKLGHFNSLAWVSHLSTGETVKNAKVEILVASPLSLSAKQDIRATSHTNSEGLAELPGVEKLDPDLQYLNEWNSKNPLFIAKVTKDSDVAFLPVYYEFRAHNYSTYSHSEKKHGHIEVWGTSAQGVYKAGETIQFKLYVRNNDRTGLVPAPKKDYTLKIIDPLGKTLSTKTIQLNSFGAYDGEFELLPSATSGNYQFDISAKFTKKKWHALSVLVSDFTPSPFKVSTNIKGSIFEAGDEIAIESSARLHAGGPYTNANIRVTSYLHPSRFYPDKPALKGFSFSDIDSIPNSPVLLNKTNGLLDNDGDYSTSFDLSANEKIEYGTIKVETSVKDDRAKFVSARKKALYFGRDRFVGLHIDTWTLKKGVSQNIRFAVVDPQGELQEGTEVRLWLEREEVVATRVKGAGSSYLTKYTTKWVKEESCSKTSERRPVSCSLTPQQVGYYKVVAEIRDTNGRLQKSGQWRYSTGSGANNIWNSGTNYKLDIVPEKKQYSIGDTAKFLVKNPYPGARALISIERYGILKSYTTVLENSLETIEVPIEEDYMPGFYFSVVLSSPRVSTENIEDSSTVDLGKPAFRIGYAEIKVSDPIKQLSVKVQSEKSEYKPRDTVDLTINAVDSSGSAISGEFAVIVLDEAVFDLLPRGNNYFDPYDGFYNLRSLDVRNFNLLRQLVGQRKFEKKGANPGGGGGGKADSIRDTFKYVAYWNPSLLSDSTGRASLSFKAPDNLTAWRVLVLAADKKEKFGLGIGSFKVNKKIELRPAMPNQVVEGDSFSASVTVMNRDSIERTLDVDFKAEGKFVESTSIQKQLELAPFERQNVFLPINTLRGVSPSLGSSVKLHVSAHDELDSDSTIFEVPIQSSASLQTASTFQSSVASTLMETIRFPDTMRGNVGALSFIVSPSLISSLEGSFSYMRDYPYSCWEQKLSKGLAAAHYLQLKRYLPESFEWKEADKLVEQTLREATSFQAPNGGMTYHKARNEFVSPFLSAYTAQAFASLKASGKEIPSEVEKRLFDYLKLFLRKNVQPGFYSDGMASTVRALALSALAEAKQLSKEDLARHASHRKQMSLYGKSQLLRAALQLEPRSNLSLSLIDEILSHSQSSSGATVFKEKEDRGFRRILSSGLRTNCSILKTIMNYREKVGSDRKLDRLPEQLVNYVIKAKRGESHWPSTQENSVCLDALSTYSRVYESVQPNYSFSLSVMGEVLGSSAFDRSSQTPKTFTRANSSKDSSKEATVVLEKKGNGRAYLSTNLSYALESDQRPAINSGIVLVREYSVERDGHWVSVEKASQIEQGDLLRVDLFIETASPRHFVVVQDEVPGGLEPINTLLATSSQNDFDKAKSRLPETSHYYSQDKWFEFTNSRWGFYHQELQHDFARFYSEYLPAGEYHLSYTAQVVSPGRFLARPAKAEEMYEPSTFGSSENYYLQVGPAK